jgi:hypothetical protein
MLRQHFPTPPLARRRRVAAALHEVLIGGHTDEDYRPHHRNVERESLFHYTSLGPNTGSTVRKLAALKPTILATMHGSSFSGDGATALNALGDHYDVLLDTRVRKGS